MSLRVLRPARHDLATLAASGTVDADGVALLRAVVAARLAFLVVGGTGSGKTTLLAALLGEVAPSERIVCVEDAEELRPAHPHVVRMVARPANVEGAGQVLLRDLVRQALRMRPDRLVVGEVRGAEVVELLAALNTGHDGGAGTVHANAPRRGAGPAGGARRPRRAGSRRAAQPARRRGAGGPPGPTRPRRDAHARRRRGPATPRRGRRGRRGAGLDAGDGWATGRADLGAMFQERGVAAPWLDPPDPPARPSATAPRAVSVAAGVSLLHRESA